MNKIEFEECEATGNIPNKNENRASTDITKTKIVGIYGLRNKINDRWYVGQSWDIFDRWKEAYQYMGCKNQKKIYNALKKYGYESFEKRIIEMCDSDIPQSMLDLKEDIWINHYNSIKHGYNLKSGGSRGKPSQESRLKMSIAHKGVRLSPEHRNNMVAAKQFTSLETRQRMSAAHLGKKRPVFSPEHRKNLSNWQIGRRLSVEHRAKLSASKVGKTWSGDRKMAHSTRMQEAYRLKAEREASKLIIS